MKTATTYEVEIEIDKLTNSIVNVISGESFETELHGVTEEDMNMVTRKAGWLFDWKKESKREDAKVYKLSIIENKNIIQGLVSLSDMGDHMFLNIAESAPFNRDEHKLYEGVGGSLFAYCCKQSFDNGNDGIIAFVAKTKLIEHYRQTLGAEIINGHKMVILPEKALFLINKYFNN